MDLGVVVLGHGSRVAEANKTVQEISSLVKSMTGITRIEACYMARCRPNLREGVENLVRQGVKKIVVIPLFLYNGLHVLEDIPEELEKIKKSYGSQVEIVFGNTLGSDRRIAEIVIERIKEVS